MSLCRTDLSTVVVTVVVGVVVVVVMVVVLVVVLEVVTSLFFRSTFRLTRACLFFLFPTTSLVQLPHLQPLLVESPGVPVMSKH